MSKHTPHTKENSPILTVTDLHINYTMGRNLFLSKKRRFHAVKGVTFEIREGETFAIVGESGCGKTSIVMAILRFVKPKSGTIIFKNHNIWEVDKKSFRKIRKKMRPVFQDSNSALSPRMTIGKAIGDGFLKKNKNQKYEVEKKTRQLLNLVGLTEDYYHRYPHQLSGGQKQRVCIARALASEPDLLIFDEPLSSQDLSIQANLINLLLDLKVENNLTYLLISHDLWVVQSFAERVAVMKNGRIVEMAKTKNIFHHPNHPYTRTLLDSSYFSG